MLVFVLAVGAVFVEWPMIIGSIGGALYMLYNYWRIRGLVNSVPERVSILPGSLDVTLVAGGECRQDLVIESELEEAVTIELPYGSLDNPEVPPGVRYKEFVFKPELAARYDFDGVEVGLVSDLDLFTGVASVPFDVSVRVFPRVFSAAIDALGFLEGLGIQGAGEQVSQMKGRGYEYADSREYVPGDSLNMINWKATARLNRLIVKEHYMESSGAIHVVFENMVSDPVSSDVLSACFLRTVQSFAEVGWVVGLTVIEDGEIKLHHVDLHPDRAVSSALRYVLDTRVQEFQSYFEVLDPVFRPRLELVMDGELPVGRFEMGRVKEELFRSQFAGVIYVTCLVDNPVNMIEIADAARLSGTRMVALEPCSPWMYGSLEDAYRILGHYEKMNRNLMRSGVGVAVSVEEAQQKMGELELVWA